MCAVQCGYPPRVTLVITVHRKVWYTKRVKSTDTGRSVFQNYGSTRIVAGRPVYLRIHPYVTGLLAFTGRPVCYGSTRILNTSRPVNILVDPYFKNTGRPVICDRICDFGPYGGTWVKLGFLHNLTCLYVLSILVNF